MPRRWPSSSQRRFTDGLFKRRLSLLFSAPDAGALLRGAASGSQRGAAACEPGVLRLGGTCLSVFNALYHRAQLRLGSRHPGAASAGAFRQARADRGRGPQPGTAGLVQICGLFGAHAPPAARSGRAACSGDRAPDRHFVLYLPVAELYDRRLPRRGPGAARPVALRHLRLDVPPTHRGPHRPLSGRGRTAREPGGERYPVCLGRTAVRDRSLQKTAARQSHGRAVGGPADAAGNAQRLGGDVRLLAADLLRLLRLLRYGHRARPAVRL